LLKAFDTVEKTWLAKSARLNGIQSVNYYVMSGFLRSLRDPIRVHRIDNRVPRIRNLSTGPQNQRNRVGTGPHWVPNIFLKRTCVM